MDVKEFNAIKEKVERLKESKIRAEAVIDSIFERWKKDFGVSSLEEVNTKLESLKEEAQENDTQLEEWMQELRLLTNWNLV